MPRTTRVTGITISLALAACGARSTTPPPRVDPPIAIVDAAVEHAPDAAPPVTIITPSKPGVRTEAPHGGMITDLAVTPDGTAAVTSDDLGGHRVWPTLDGSIEPRVIELPPPTQVAIGHDPKGFLIALIDEAGGLVLQQIDRDGLLVKRATLPLEPTYKGLAMTDRGPLAWRSDQRIVRLDADGAIVAQLETEPGQRLLTLAVPAVKHAERAVAIVEGATDNTNWRRARWMSIGDKLAWGDWIALGDDLGPVAAVSPSLERLAVVIGTQSQARAHVFDLTAAKLLVAEQAFSAVAIAFPDDAHVAYNQQNGQTHWVTIGVLPRSTRAVLLTQPTGAGALASGGGRTVNPNGNELAISDATGTSYLGYGIQGVQQATAADHGQLAIAHGDRTALLNDQLRAAQMPVVPIGDNVTLMRWLGGKEFAVQSTRVGTGVTSLSLVDLETGTRSAWRTNQVASQLNYEPSTKLLAVSYGQQPEIARYVPGKLRVDSVATYPKPGPYDRVHLWPVSPQRSGGTQVVTAISRDTTTVRWVPDARALDKGVATTIDGSVAAVDATGKVYAWQNTNGKLELGLFRDAKRIGKLELEPGGRSVWPDPMGERVIVSGHPRLVLFGPDGARVWARSFPGITHVVWLDDGALAVVTALGIARLDAKTGETLVKRCGWAFELASKPHAARARIAPMCTPQ